MKTQNSLTLASLLTITCLASQVQANLITNGGFEAPLVANVGQFLSIPGWTLDGSSLGTTFEIQNTNLGLGPAYQGAQYCELNSTGTTSMYQDIATVPGTYYNVSYAFSPRIGVTDNNLRFY